MVPALAKVYLPVLLAAVQAHWPGMPVQAMLAGQVEQETCPSLTSSKCWNPRAELKTSREYGFGLGQLTVTQRFDNFASARALHPSLAAWRWEDRYRADHQLRALVLMDRIAFERLRPGADNNHEGHAFMLSAYNGGAGGVLKDRRLCQATPGCDARRWFGHVERRSTKSKTRMAGYGKSLFEINREYVRNVMGVRMARYADWMARRGSA